MQLSLTERVAETYGRLFADAEPPERLGIALSGGGDSTALLLATRAALPRMELRAATVDHRLRQGSGREAEDAGALCARLGIAHDVLTWEGWSGQGNLQDAARSARRALLGDWARRHGLAHLALGHTRDDQAETVLMRLARGSGVDGLAAMAPMRRSGSVTWLRPLLDISRDDLRDYLRAEGQSWVEDPSNEDARFARVRARSMGAALAELGLTPERLVRTARQMALARSALDDAAKEHLAARGEVQEGDVLLPLAMRDEMPREIFLRILSHCLTWVASARYRPRYDALTACVSELPPGKSRTLHGCLVTRESGYLRISREFAAVAGLRAGPAASWDTRWCLRGPAAPEGSHIGPLGAQGLASCSEWRRTGLPRASLLSSPALWRGEQLIAAPLAALSAGYTAQLCRGAEHLVSSLGMD